MHIFLLRKFLHVHAFQVKCLEVSFVCYIFGVSRVNSSPIAGIQNCQLNLHVKVGFGETNDV
uniref:Uncharacterized protein n=1 Tax=Solanum lycopersicum TaxID=4081 RepID=A0A3Q7I699_SOLLC